MEIRVLINAEIVNFLESKVAKSKKGPQTLCTDLYQSIGKVLPLLQPVVLIKFPTDPAPI